jgi:uncharacterized membrane protein YphA (DoxX/SURF4 family)
MSREQWVQSILRIGLAFAFLFPPINALFDPYSWLGYFPGFTRGYVDDMLLLHGFGVAEVVIALWLLSGWKVFWPALAALLMLIGIVYFDRADFQVLFRDLSIAAMALALMVAHAPRRPAISSNM